MNSESDILLLPVLCTFNVFEIISTMISRACACVFLSIVLGSGTVEAFLPCSMPLQSSSLSIVKSRPASPVRMLADDSAQSALHQSIIVLKISLDKGKETVAVERGADWVGDMLQKGIREITPNLKMSSTPSAPKIEYSASGYNPRLNGQMYNGYGFSGYDPQNRQKS